MGNMEDKNIKNKKQDNTENSGKTKQYNKNSKNGIAGNKKRRNRI